MLDAGRARVRLPTGPDDRRRADRVQGPRRAAHRGNALATRRRDGQTRLDARADGRLPAWWADVAGLSRLGPVQAAPGPRGLRIPRRRFPRLDRLRARVPQ